MINLCIWKLSQPFRWCHCSIKSFPHHVRGVVFMPSKHWANKAQVNEFTFIQNFPKRLHLIVWPNPPSNFFRLSHNLIKITRTNPCTWSHVLQSSQSIQSFMYMASVRFSIKPCEAPFFVGILINLCINVILGKGLNIKNKTLLPKQN